MADDVKITVTAVDNASTTIGGIQGAMLSFNLAMQAAEVIQRAFKAAYDATVGTLLTYADSVKTLSIITNTSTESVSRLITVTDRFGVGVGNLETASRKLATQGLSLTLDTVAKLSDEFLKLNTGAERQTFMTQNLGRATAEWAEILSQGSAAILANGAAVQGSLILTQKQIDETHDYQMKLVDLDQKWQSMKVNAGELTLPIVMKIVQGAINFTGGGDMKSGLEAVNQQILASSTNLEDYKKKWNSFFTVDVAVGAGLAGVRLDSIFKGATEATYENAKALQAWNENSYETTIAAGKMGKAISDLKQPVIDNSQYATSMSQEYQKVVGQFGITSDMANAVGMAFGQLDDKMLKNIVNLHNFDAAIQAWGNKPINKQIILSIWYQVTGSAGEWQPGIDYGNIPGQTGSGGGKGKVGPTGKRDPSTGKMQYLDPDGTYSYRAGGGSFSGWAMVGDSPGGGVTPYTEYVYAPQGAVVYNQSQMSGQSAPPMAAGGVIGGNGMELSDRALSKLADLFTMALAKNK